MIYEGTVRSVVQARGFFFLSPPDQGTKDIFCHFSELDKAGMREPQVREKIRYQIQVTPKGPQATALGPVI